MAHALAPDWPGPLCNNGVAGRRVTGTMMVGREVSCYACREILAGRGGPWTDLFAKRNSAHS